MSFLIAGRATLRISDAFGETDIEVENVVAVDLDEAASPAFEEEPIRFSANFTSTMSDETIRVLGRGGSWQSSMPDLSLDTMNDDGTSVRVRLGPASRMLPRHGGRKMRMRFGPWAPMAQARVVAARRRLRRAKRGWR